MSIGDLDVLWQSRPVGQYRGEPCLVLDDLGDRLHVVYLGRDTLQARQLGYWEIDREVFEVVVPRPEVTGRSEEVVEIPLAAVTFPPSGALPGPAARAVPPRGRRAARRERISAQAMLADLLDQAAIPRNSYAVDAEVPGAMCLVKADGGYEVFSSTGDARLEVRFFEAEEAAYFYLFGVLAAEAVRGGLLGPGLLT